MKKEKTFPLIDLLSQTGAPIFGVAGTHIMKLLREISRAGLEKNYYPAGTELSAGFMATGFARANGRAAFCLLTPGPGFLISSTAMLECAMKATPVVFLSGQVSSHVMGKGGKALHEFPGQKNAASALMEATYFPSSPEEVDRMARMAVTGSLSIPFAPAYLEIPSDFMSEYERERPLKIEPPSSYPSPDEAAISIALETIKESKQPVILAGHGALMGTPAGSIASFAERIGAPVVSTISGKGVLSEWHGLSAGVYASIPGRELFERSDLLISLGTSFSYMSTQNREAPFPERIINVNCLDRPPLLPGCHITHVKAALPDFINMVNSRYKGEIREGHRGLETMKDGARERARKDFPLEIACVEAVERAMGKDDLIFTDPTILSYWMRHFFRVRGEKCYFYPSGSNSLGFALPAAAGALSSSVSRRAIVVTGDGNFAYVQGDLPIIGRSKYPITIILSNDGGYGVLRHWSGWKNAFPLGVRLPVPDFRKICQANGIEYNITHRPEELEKALKEKRGASVRLIELKGDFSPPWTLL